MDILENAQQRRERLFELLEFLVKASGMRNVDQPGYVSFAKFVEKKSIEIESAIHEPSTEPDQLSAILIEIDKGIWANMAPEEGTTLAILS